MYDTSPEPSPRAELTDLAHDADHDGGHGADECAPPVLLHELQHDQTSILSIAADGRYIYSGSQARDIFVWDRTSLRIKATLKGHTGSLLVLETCEEKKWLFSASGDSTVRIWSTETLSILYVIVPHLDTDSGDIYSLTYSPKLSTVYFGCQNTSIQWLDLSNVSTPPNTTGLRIQDSSSTPGTPGKRFHKFFDSVPQSQRNSGIQSKHKRDSSQHSTTGSLNEANSMSPPELHVPPENVISSAHYGYIYCMALSPSHLYGGDGHSDEELYLLTGSGDEEVKMWLATKEGLTEKHTFSGCEGGVLSLIARNGTIYAGCQDGNIKIFDQDTKTLLRTLLVKVPPSSTSSAHTEVHSTPQRDRNSDVLSLSILDGHLYACMGNGWCQRWCASFVTNALWQAHEGIGLSCIITSAPGHDLQSQAPAESGKAMLLTGGADANIKLWLIERPSVIRSDAVLEETSEQVEGDLQAALAEFVSFPSVIGAESYRESCRQAALWLRRLLSQLGAETTLIPVRDGINPLVLATFRGSEEHKDRPRVLFYGHYDVIPAKKTGWESDPFKLQGKNGYLYGRGVSDNKGPILATAFAISELRRKVALGLDIVMLIEGEEEAGSRGFEEVVRKHKDDIGQIDAILISNSYWIGEDIPCITYGLRGVVHATVEISNNRPDLHSGVEGGGITEPMFDLVSILNSISDGRKIMIPHFYDNVRQQSEEEKELYQLLERVTGQSASYLTAKWREPSLSIHSVQTSGPGNRTVIPASVKTQLSVRIVPDQDLAQIADGLELHVRESFARLKSPNTLNVTVDKAADWWLGNIEGPWFRALERAVEEEWGTKPLKIREGGSIPSVPFLEKTFACPALHLPMGQSSDQAHLANERISVNNLLKGKAVLERFFLSMAAGEKDV